MWKFSEVVVRQKVSSLCWHGDELVDWKWGWHFDVDGGAVMKAHTPYRFDAAISSPSGRFALLFERLGTKALLFDHGKIIRELSRSYYHAATYEYPAAFCSRPDGTELLIHCPRQYCRIDIEVAESGEILTDVPERQPSDILHSRFVVSPGGAWLASAGWVWHPWNTSEFWSVDAVLDDPRLLDHGVRPFSGEVCGVTFLDQHRLVASLIDDDDCPPKESLVTMDVRDQSLLTECALVGESGSLIQFDDNHVLDLYEYPKLLRVSDGVVVHEWLHLKTGEQCSSIIQCPLPPPFAKHRTKSIFAVADAEKVTIVKLVAV